MSTEDRPRASRDRRTQDQKAVDAIREWLGLQPLYFDEHPSGARYTRLHARSGEPLRVVVHGWEGRDADGNRRVTWR